MSDSVIAYELAAFRSRLASRPDTLASSIHSADGLVRAFVRSVATRDTAALTAMAISPEEFAYLYYPNSPMSRPPYSLEPDLMWLQITMQTARGRSRLASDYMGKPLGFVRHECSDPQIYGRLTLLRICRVFYVAGRDTVAEQLFGSIIAVDGRYKFVGYANTL